MHKCGTPPINTQWIECSVMQMTAPGLGLAFNKQKNQVVNVKACSACECKHASKPDLYMEIFSLPRVIPGGLGKKLWNGNWPMVHP